MEFKVVETFISLSVAEMDRAVAFYSRSLGAVTSWTSPRWTSLTVAGVRIGLFLDPTFSGQRIGLHFAVTDIHAACAVVARSGGEIVTAVSEIAPAVLAAEVSDTEGNIFWLQRASS